MKKYLILLTTFLMTIRVYSDPMSLAECIQLALMNNPDLLKSDYSLRQAGVSQKQAVSAVFPSVSANASASNDGPFISEMNDVWSQSLSGNVNQQFYAAGLYSNIGLAKERYTSAELSYASLENQIRTSAERLYLQILASDTLIGVYEANIRLSDEQTTKMRTMVDLGLKRPSDLLKSEVQRGTFESSLIREIETLASAKRSLNILLGQLPNNDLDILPLDVDVVTVPDYESGLATMLENNPNIKQFETQVKIQNLSLRIAREAYLPSLSGSYSASQRNNVLGGPAINSDQISLHLNINLFDGFSKNLNVQKSKLSLDEAQLDYEALLRDLDEALSNQYAALETQNRLITIHETNLASARQDLAVVSEQYANGFSSILDLTDAQVSVLESETNLLRDLYTRKQIESEIKRLIGK